MSSTTDAKKHITEITAEYRPYWQPVFDATPNPNPQFSAKLCYMGKEFSNGGTAREACVRFFPNELSDENGIFIELFNWDQEHYEKGYRVLYYLAHDPHWRTDDSYKQITTTTSGAKLATPTYAVRISDLVMVNKTSIKSLGPEITKTPEKTGSKKAKETIIELESIDETLLSEDDLDDNHYTQMTMRDLYCMLQNVPLSNKKWLNKLIQTSETWQKK